MSASSTQPVTLVTGGGGFIGSHLVEHLVARGDRVVIVDNFSTGRRENLSAVDPGAVEIIEGRIGDRIEDFPADAFHEIYHLAAAVGVRLVIEQPVQTIETNILETSALLRYAAEASTPVLLASTSEIYGKSQRTPFAESDDVVYGNTQLHRWSYACSKAIDEYLALAYQREREVPVTIARLFNTVGPRQVGDYGMVLPRFVARALAGTPLEVYGDGTQLRCFCDVRDVVTVLPRMLASAATIGEVFNVGHDEPISILDLARLVIDTLGSASDVRVIPYDEAFGPGFDDLPDRRPDLTRLRALVGFQPRFALADTIRDVAEAIAASPPSARPAAS